MTGAIILAAGASTRLGTQKQNFVYKGKTLLHHALHAAQELPANPIVVVSGYTNNIVNCQEYPGVEVVVNEAWCTGMASSIRCGLETMLYLQPAAEQVIVLLCDQPFVSGALLVKMVMEQQRSGKPIVASAYNDTLGAPVLFMRQYFSALRELSGQEGARKLLQQHKQDVASVAFPEGAIDIDTPADVERLMKL